MGLCKSNSYTLNTFFFSIFLIHVCYSTPHLSLSFHWIVLKLVLNIQETLKKHTIIVRLYFFRVDGPQRRSHSSTGHLPSRGPSHRLGGSRSHLQGSVAAAHPLHSCCPGEVRSHLVSYFEHLFSCLLSAAVEPPLLCVQVQRCVQVPPECSAGAVAAAALLGSTDAEETPQVQPDRCC